MEDDRQARVDDVRRRAIERRRAQFKQIKTLAENWKKDRIDEATFSEELIWVLTN